MELYGVGAKTFEGSIEVLKIRGMMVAFGNASGYVDTIDVKKHINAKGIFFTRPSIAHYTVKREELEESAKKVFDAVLTGKFKIEISKKYNLDDVKKAHEDLEGRKLTGVPQKNIVMLDSKGVLYKGRDNLNQWKSAYAIETKNRTLEETIKDADVFLGLSSKSILSKKMVKKMAKNPIIFACANPDPEITPEEVNEVRKDAIIATGRSDY